MLTADEVAGALRARASRGGQIRAMQILLGLAVTMATVLFVGWFVWLILLATPFDPTLVETLAWTAVILVPALFWQEWRTKGRFVDSRIGDFDETDVAMGYAAPWIANVPFVKVQVFAITEILLTGPRFVLGTTGGPGVSAVHADEAAELAIGLAKRRGRSTPVASFDVSPAAVATLANSGWAMVSGDGERIWLTSEGKTALAELVRHHAGVEPASP